jgi:hypothetical protein
MASNDLNLTDSARELREIAGDDATATFEADPKFIDSNPADTASSENLGPAGELDDDIAGDDDDDLDDEYDDEEDEDEDEEEDDEDEEADADDADTLHVGGLSARGVEGEVEADDDTGDDGRENAVDEDKLRSSVEDDLDDKDPPMDREEAEGIRERLSVGGHWGRVEQTQGSGAVWV